MTNLFRSTLRMGVLHKAMLACPGVEIRVRVDDLTNVHEILTLESGHPIYRPQNIFHAQDTKYILADESNDDQLIRQIKMLDVQAVMKSMVIKHYEKRIKSISEFFIIDWPYNMATVIEIGYTKVSAKPPPGRT